MKYESTYIGIYAYLSTYVTQEYQ